MDVTISRSTNDLFDVTALYLTAIVAVILGLALLAEWISETFAHRLMKPPSYSLLRLASRARPVQRRMTGRERDAGRIVVRLAHRDQAVDAAPGDEIESSERRYVIQSRLACGDVANTFSAKTDGQDFILKIARADARGSLLSAEARWLRLLARQSGDCRYVEYFPRLVESFVARVGGRGRPVNVFARRPG
ncbi:MAG TPA: hypothetical protein VKB78_16000, partial [Pirellulales bacterium]|nr:hypothetical protein [Pirellulales bacterium]